MVVDTSLPCNQTVATSDSSDLGFAVLERSVDIDVVQSWGRECERWRFETEEAVSARKLAL